MKKTIFIFIGGYLPAEQYGGPVTSIANIVENLSEDFDFRIVTSNHDLKSSRPLEGIHDGWNTVKGAEVLYLKDSDFTRKNFVNILGKFEPELVYLSGIFNYSLNLPAFYAAKRLNIPVLLAPRGELCENALSLKKPKKLLFISALKLTGYFKNMFYQATSEEEQQAITDVLNVDKEKIYLLPNMHGIEISKSTRKKEKGKLKIVFLARIAKKKNLLYAINIVNQLKGDISFEIFGPVEDNEYWGKCCKLIEAAPENVKIKYCGPVSPTNAKYIYADYDCLFFPTLSENYGHVIVEAMLANCPVVISTGTTPWDDVNDQGGFTADLNEDKDFIEILEDLVSIDAKEYMNLIKKLHDYSKSKFEVTDLNNKYLQMFGDVATNKIRC